MAGGCRRCRVQKALGVKLKTCEKCRARCRDYSRRHPEKMAAIAAAAKADGRSVKYSQKWRSLNRAQALQADRRSALRRKFNISVSEYEEMLKAQHGVCAICFRKETSKCRDKVRELAVDHDHITNALRGLFTNALRGLLCSSCNNGLGRFADRPDWLRAAANYLEKSKES
jgi:hypothetical protein